FNVCKLSFIALTLSLLPGSVQALPDLMLAVERAKLTIEYKRRAFDTTDCAFQEGCVFNTGGRKLLLLDAGLKNMGASDLEIGDPVQNPDLFKWSPCHMHYHMKGIANYRVLTLSGRQVARTYPGEARIQIAHDQIPGYMQAMTMDFDAKDPDALTGLQPGDRVRFNLVVTREKG